MYNEGRFPEDGDVLMPDWTADGHLEEGTIHTWLDREYNAANSEVIEAHIGECVACQELVAEARGLLAGASRITALLDAVPVGVLPSHEAPLGVVPQIAATKNDATGAGFGAVGRTRPWYGQRLTRFAAAVLVFVGGAAVWSNLPSPSVSDFTDSAQKVSAPEASTSAQAEVSRRAAPLAAPSAPEPMRAAPPAAKASGKIAGDAANSAAERRERVTESVAAPPVAAPPVAADRVQADRGSRTGVALASPPAPKEAVIAGRVVDERGAGLASISVSESVGAKTVVTDSSGRFTMRTRLDSVELVARGIGFQPAQTRVVIDGRDSVTVAIPIAKSVQSLASVMVTSDVQPLVERARMPFTAVVILSPSAEVCLAYQPSGVGGSIAGMNVREGRNENRSASVRDDAASTAAVPQFILVERAVDSLNVSSQRRLTTWNGALNTNLPVSVMMSSDSSGLLQGTQLLGRLQLQLSIRHDSGAWAGTATYVNGLSQSTFPVRYTVAASSLCHF